MGQTQTQAAESEQPVKTKFLTGAQAIMQSLVEQGVTTIFGYPGGAIMPTYDALFDYQDRLKHILVRHEQGAGHAAQGYARMLNKAGVCMVTSGPGATNLIIDRRCDVGLNTFGMHRRSSKRKFIRNRCLSRM